VHHESLPIIADGADEQRTLTEGRSAAVQPTADVPHVAEDLLVGGSAVDLPGGAIPGQGEADGHRMTYIMSLHIEIIPI
jgi:hypothetical protein